MILFKTNSVHFRYTKIPSYGHWFRSVVFILPYLDAPGETADAGEADTERRNGVGQPGYRAGGPRTANCTRVGAQ